MGEWDFLFCLTKLTKYRIIRRKSTDGSLFNAGLLGKAGHIIKL